MKEDQLSFGSRKSVAAAQDRSLALRVRVENVLIDLWSRLGLPAELARQRVEKEFARVIPKTVLAELSAQGITIEGKRVLDLGAGLGGLSLEVAAQGGHVVAIEPDSAWCLLARDRLREVPSSAVLEAVGEHLPLADESFDLIISLQVLEHVHDPAHVLREAWRVLRPGGFFYLACENYLAFREPHYDVVWLPLLPKALGALYLRMRGRSPDFLLRAVTYTTAISVRRDAMAAGFLLTEDEKLRVMVGNPTGSGIMTRLARILSLVLPEDTVTRILISLRICRTLFRVGIYHILEKPVERKPFRNRAADSRATATH